MSFLPYDANLLRCHPLVASIQNTNKDISNVRTKSHLFVDIKCSKCNTIFHGRVASLVLQTNQCKDHKKEFSKYRAKYVGNIPKSITQPIRCCLLNNVDMRQCLDLIKCMSPICTEEDPDSVAQAYINEIATFNKIDLADNCFWGDDSASRVTKERYKRPKKKRKIIEEESTSFKLGVCFNLFICMAISFFVQEARENLNQDNQNTDKNLSINQISTDIANDQVCFYL